MTFQLSCGCKGYQDEDFELMGAVDCFWATWEVCETGLFQASNYGIVCEKHYVMWNCKLNEEELSWESEND